MAPTRPESVWTNTQEAARRQLRRVLAAQEAPPQISAPIWESFVSGYLAHRADLEHAAFAPPTLGAQVARHFALGRVRPAQEDLVDISFGQADHPSALVPPGSALIQIVTDDRQFLVDTLVMEFRRQNWTLSRLEHPQFHVIRHQGEFQRLAGAGDRAE
ncbi:MAG: NAD-glutamate dehydrogenase, partial [Propionibacteriaceae bacterium]|nr:NAD-glutamate dehydrogenase [Propionibacteriaceae bacterium]